MLGSALSDLLGGGGNKRQRPDYRQSFYLALAKVLGAAAWIDGPINQAEVNVVKSLLNELSPRLTTRELQPAQRYLAEPVPREHWSELLVQLSEFTRRRARLQFAVQRLHALLVADGEPSQAESELFHQAQTLLGWRDLERGTPAAVADRDERTRRGDAPDPAAAVPESAVEGVAARAVSEAAAGTAASGSSLRGLGTIRADGTPSTASESAVPAPAEAGIRLGDLSPEPGAAAASPALADRVHAAAVARLAGTRGSEPPPRKLAVLAAAMAHVTMRRAGTEGEDAELVGFAAAVSAVDDAVAEAVLDAAREQSATAAELTELAGELRVRTSPVEIAALAKLLNAMADGEAALRRLRELTGLHR